MLWWMRSRPLIELMLDTLVQQAVVGELIANSLDASSSNIYIDFSRRASSLTVTDYGCGMGSDEFSSITTR